MKAGITLAAVIPTTIPATVPTSESYVARAVNLPTGFVQIVMHDRTAICEPPDQIWVRDVLARTPPGTQASTRPSDLLSRLKARELTLENQMSYQLDLNDNRQAVHFVADTLVPLAVHLDRLCAKIVYLVATREDIKRLVISGWGGDQFHYNQVADKVAFNGVLDISLDAADGESIVPAPYLSDDSLTARSDALREALGRTEGRVADMISREALSAMQLSLAKFIVEAGIAPLNSKLAESWFAVGVVGELSSEFMAQISGAKPQDIVAIIAQPDPGNPVPLGSIDLAHPIPPDQLRPEIAAAYADAFRRRSIAVVAAWAARAGPDAIKKTLHAIRTSQSSDGPALLELIRKTTGIDLAEQLQPQ